MIKFPSSINIKVIGDPAIERENLALSAGREIPRRARNRAQYIEYAYTAGQTYTRKCINTGGEQHALRSFRVIINSWGVSAYLFII